MSQKGPDARGDSPSAPRALPLPKWALAIAAVLVVIIGAWLLLRQQGSGHTTTTGGAATRTSSSTSAAGTSTIKPTSPAISSARTATTTTPTRPGPDQRVDGFKQCPLSSLPPEVADTTRAISSGGPFRFPRNDNVTFGNREQRLPKQPQGYYREHTVVTPGSPDRGARRVVTGGKNATTPDRWYYTGDHYETFCVIGMSD